VATGSTVYKALERIPGLCILRYNEPRWVADRLAPSASSDFPEAVELVMRLYDQFGCDTADNSPLSASWRTRAAPTSMEAETADPAELMTNLAAAPRILLK
jgi:predicted dinucleotide-binding enzyme